MMRRPLRGVLVLALLLLAGEATAQAPAQVPAQVPAQAPAYRWVDDRGNVHYVGRRDQVPEIYRGQLAPTGPAEPPKPRLPQPLPQSAHTRDPNECVLRFRGTAARPGSSRSYPTCEACWKALNALGGEERARAECIAGSVKSYR
jgi:hypothetical protein